MPSNWRPIETAPKDGTRFLGRIAYVPVMTWDIERDENGEPARMIWRGPDEQTFGELLKAELSRCPECGFPCGWHKRTCRHSAVIGNEEPHG